MWKCPVCSNNEKKDGICLSCGYDERADFVQYRTVSRVADADSVLWHSLMTDVADASENETAAPFQPQEEVAFVECKKADTSNKVEPLPKKVTDEADVSISRHSLVGAAAVAMIAIAVCLVFFINNFGGSNNSENGRQTGENSLAADGTTESIAPFDSETEDTDGADVKNVVAAIGDCKYESINDAVKEAEYNDEIMLMADTIENVIVPEGKTITLNLNGHKLINKDEHTIVNYGDLSVMGEGIIDNTTHFKAALLNETSGAAFLSEGVVLTRSEEAGTPESDGSNSYYTVENHGYMHIDGAEIYNYGQYSSNICNGWREPDKNTEKIEAALEVASGRFVGGRSVLRNAAYGTAFVLGGSFEEGSDNLVSNRYLAFIEGGVFEDSVYAIINNGNGSEGQAGVFQISGGEFRTNELCDITNSSEPVVIMGGTYSMDLNKYDDYIPNGYDIIKNKDNSYSVIEK